MRDISVRKINKNTPKEWDVKSIWQFRSCFNHCMRYFNKRMKTIKPASRMFIKRMNFLAHNKRLCDLFDNGFSDSQFWVFYCSILIRSNFLHIIYGLYFKCLYLLLNSLIIPRDDFFYSAYTRRLKTSRTTQDVQDENKSWTSQ